MPGARPVVVVGSLNLDTVLRVRDLPAAGQTVAALDRQEGPGGKGANQAVAAARAGAAVAMVGRVGDDPAGARLRDALAAEGVAVDLLRPAAAPTGSALVLVSDAGENSIVVHAGANAALSGEDARAGVAGRRPVVLAQLEVPVPALLAAGHACRAAGGTFVLTPGPVPPDGVPEELLALTDVLVSNEGELALLAGADDVRPGAAALAGRFPALDLVVTLGARGALVVAGGAPPVTVPAPRVRAVDTTGAGDVLAGTLGAALAGGAALLPAVQRGVAAAAASVTRLGAQTAPRAGGVEAARP